MRQQTSFVPVSLALTFLPLSLSRGVQNAKRDLTIVTLNGWESLGCWSDDQASRTLSLMAHSGQHVSDDNCQYQCTQLGYNYAGTEYSGQCFCDNYINSAASHQADSDCNMPCTGQPSQPCGAANRINLFWNGQTAPPPPVTVTNPGVNGWICEGCYTDSTGARTLSNRIDTVGGGSAMTIALCTSACNSAGYTLAGAEYHGECYCANDIVNNGPASDQTICSMACNGNSTEYCGGAGAMNLYSFGGVTPATTTTTTTTTAPVTSATVALPPSWATLGCYTDTNGQRALGNFFNNPNGGMTVEYCVGICGQNSFAIAGVEYGGECYCDNQVQNNHGIAPDGSTGCNMACSGNAGETCGGPNRLNAYAAGPGWVQLGCYTDQPYKRTLAKAVSYSGGLTTDTCLAACSAAGYSLAGTEYGQECHCGNSFDNGGGPAPDGSAGCSFACSGNSSEICGGNQRLSLYEYINADGTVSTTVSATATPTATAVSGSASSAASTPTGPVLPSGWSYGGCYIDNAHGRILANQQPDSSSLTIESCVSTCLNLGFSIAGQEYSSQCFCGQEIIAGGALASTDSECAMTCSGNSDEICGGPARMSIYATGAVQIIHAPVAQESGLPSTWTYQGCISDDVGHRTFQYQTDLGQANTATACLDQCSSMGYSVGGMEYSTQCSCSGTSNITASGASASTNCNMACSGDVTSICGGPGAITYYSM